MDIKKEFEEYLIKTKSPTLMSEDSFINYRNKYISGSNFDARKFLTGKIYSFYYDSDPIKGGFVNNRPVIFFLGVSKFNDKPTIEGIDIILMPPPIRLNFLNRISSVFNSIIERNIQNGNFALSQQERLKIDYSSIESIMVGIDYKNCFSRYHIEKMKNIHEIEYGDWVKTIYLNTRSIKGSSLEEIYKRNYKI